MKQAMNEATRTRACELFQALSNPVRLRIVEAMLNGEMSVGEVASAMNIGHSGASQHLALLARAGVLVSEQRGTSRIYRVRGPRIGQIVGLIEEFCHVHRLFGAPDEVDNE